jgi:hypothetical protein
MMDIFSDYTDTLNYILSYCSNVEICLFSVTSKKIRENVKCPIMVNLKNIMKYAINNEKTIIMDLVHDMGYKFTNDVAIYTAKRQSIKMLQYLVNNKCPMNEDVCTFGALNKDVFIFLKENNIPHDASIYFMAISGDDCDFVQWLFKTYKYPISISHKFNDHKNITNLNIYKFMYDNSYVGIESFHNNINNLLEKQKYDVITWIFELKTDFIDYYTCDVFAYSIDTIKWYYANINKDNTYLSIEEKIMQYDQATIISKILTDKDDNAVIDKLIWIHKIQHIKLLRPHYKVIFYKKRNKVLQWIVDNNLLEKKAYICCEAIMYEAHYFIKYWLEHNYPVTSEVLGCAFGLIDGEYLIKYLLDIKCPLSNTYLDNAIEYGNIEALKMLKENGAIFGESEIKTAIYSNDIKCIKYIVKNANIKNLRSSDTCKDIFMSAIAFSNLEIIEYLFKIFCVEYDDNFFRNTHYIEILEWLLNNFKERPIIDIEMLNNDNVEFLKLYIENECALNINLYKEIQQQCYVNCYEYIANQLLYSKLYYTVYDIENMLDFTGIINIHNCVHKYCDYDDSYECVLKSFRKIEEIDKRINKI